METYVRDLLLKFELMGFIPRIDDPDLAGLGIHPVGAMLPKIARRGTLMGPDMKLIAPIVSGLFRRISADQ